MAQAISGDKDFGNTICQDYVGIFKEDGTMDGNWYGMRDHWYLLFEEQDKRIVDGVIHRYASDGIFNGKVIYNYYPRWYADKVENKEVYDSQEMLLTVLKFIMKVPDGLWQSLLNLHLSRIVNRKK